MFSFSLLPSPSSLVCVMPQFTESVDRFLEYQRVERGASDETLRAYRTDLEQFAAFMVDHVEDDELNPADVQLRDLRGFVASRFGADEASTIARKVSTLRSFWSFLVQKRLVNENPAAQLEAPQTGDSLRNYLKVDEVFELLDRHCPDDVLGTRDMAMWELMYGAGLRVSELVGLDRGDVDFERGWIRVDGKGDKQRQVPLGDSAERALRRYLDRRGELADSNSDPEAVFLTHRGARLSARSVRRRLKQHLRRAGLD
ncbi:MAG: tyrosine-type recombinase/integrase, partial [Bradymonadaceae bacterium]